MQVTLSHPLCPWGTSTRQHLHSIPSLFIINHSNQMTGLSQAFRLIYRDLCIHLIRSIFKDSALIDLNTESPMVNGEKRQKKSHERTTPEKPTATIKTRRGIFWSENDPLYSRAATTSVQLSHFVYLFTERETGLRVRLNRI